MHLRNLRACFFKEALEWATGLCLACASLSSSIAAAATNSNQVLFCEGFEKGLGAAWKEVSFTGKTQYTPVLEGTNHVLKAFAANSASGLAIDQKLDLKPGLRLSWRWKIDRIPEGGSETDIKTFDHTARLFVAFKSVIGPPWTVNYVWSNQLPKDQTFTHPSSGRARFIVLQAGNAKAGQWITEERDLYADWKRLFGKEPPAIEGIGLMTDSDGTKTKVTGWYDDITLRQTTP